MDGIILIDKPAGISSFGVVAKVRKAISISVGKKVKVGHAGTLDPFATGLLILMVDKATKQAGDFLKLDKSYEATVYLGKESTTADPEGEINKVSDKVPKIDAVNQTLSKLTGEIKQTPPIFSAIKIGGRRAYDLARKGQVVEMKPRNVIIHGYKDVIYEYPNLKFSVGVGSGTYIRSLAVDIGKLLGTGAYLKDLRRTSIKNYNVSEAHTLDSISPENVNEKIVSIDKI
jgi:tRNA pseudouridine55 synthase